MRALILCLGMVLGQGAWAQDMPQGPQPPVPAQVNPPASPADTVPPIMSFPSPVTNRGTPAAPPPEAPEQVVAGMSSDAVVRAAVVTWVPFYWWGIRGFGGAWQPQS